MPEPSNVVRESLHKSGIGVLGFGALTFPLIAVCTKAASSVKCPRSGMDHAVIPFSGIAYFARSVERKYVGTIVQPQTHFFVYPRFASNCFHKHYHRRLYRRSEGTAYARGPSENQTRRMDSEGQPAVPTPDAQAAIYRGELYYGRLCVL